MLGNDIVDLSYTKATTNWQRKGWLEKVCTPSEINTIYNSEDKFIAAWRIWSMKESSYKVYIQQHNSHALNPRFFQTSFTDQVYGIVQYGKASLNTKTKIDLNFIHTVAYQNEDDRAHTTAFQRQDPNQVKYELLKSIAGEFNYNPHCLELRSNKQRVPKVYINRKPMKLAISLSHHGKYAGFTHATSAS